jgi:hypothetical protein
MRVPLLTGPETKSGHELAWKCSGIARRSSPGLCGSRLQRLRKKVVSCHPEQSEGSAFSPIPRKKQIPRANCALGLTLMEFFRNQFSRDVQEPELQTP